MCYSQAAGLISVPFEMWQASDRNRMMTHTLEDELRRQRGFGNAAQTTLRNEVDDNSQTSYQAKVDSGTETAQRNYAAMRPGASTGRFALTDADKGSNSQANAASAKSSGWQQAAVQQMVKNMLAGANLTKQNQLARISETPLGLEIGAAQNADQWITVLTQVLKGAGGVMDATMGSGIGGLGNI